MKKIIITTIAIILLIGIASAGLLSFFGQISQEFETKGLTLYLDNDNLLSLNKASCTSAGSFDNQESKTWKTNNTDYFNFNDIPKADFYVRAKVTNSSQNITLTFGYFNLNNTDFEICSFNLEINSSELDNYGPLTCQATEIPENIKDVYYKMQGQCDNCKYSISKCSGEFETKIEVSKP